MPVNDRKKIVWRNLFGLCFTHTERIFWLIDLFATQCTFSDSSRQAELKYIIPDQRKSFLRRVKVVIKTCHYHKQVKYEARTSVACMILVMDMNFSMLLKTSHASPGDGGGIFGLGIISGLGTCVNLRTCSNI